MEVKQPDALTNIPNSWGNFIGDYSEWPGFRDRYKSRMHDRKDVLITHKWGYLRSSLSGDALRAMGNWQDTDENSTANQGLDEAAGGKANLPTWLQMEEFLGSTS